MQEAEKLGKGLREIAQASGEGTRPRTVDERPIGANPLPLFFDVGEHRTPLLRRAR